MVLIDRVLVRSVVVFSAPPTAVLYTLSLHDALPICRHGDGADLPEPGRLAGLALEPLVELRGRSEEHTSELHSLRQLVCRLLLEKKNQVPTCRLMPPSSRSRSRSLHSIALCRISLTA